MQTTDDKWRERETTWTIARLNESGGDSPHRCKVKINDIQIEEGQKMWQAKITANLSFVVRILHLATFCIFVLLLLCCMGCSPSGPVRVPVSGLVTWDGQPIPVGDILFEAADGSPAADAGKIVEGKYSLLVTVGAKKVQIHASREEGLIDPVMNVRPRKPYVPAEYNAMTRLTAEVRPSGENRFDFALPQK